MYRMYRIATAVVFAVHLMVGCCWHHAHGDQCRNVATAAQHQCPADHDAQGDGSQHGPFCCQGSKCSFAAPHNSSGNTLVQFPQLYAVAAQGDLFSPQCEGRHQGGCRSGLPCPTIRLHLVNQVMLI